MTYTFEKELKEFVDSIKIGSSYFTIHNRRFDYKGVRISKVQRIDILKDFIYRTFHCKYYNPNANKLRYERYKTSDFVNELSYNNYGKGMWEYGWRVLRIENNKILMIHKDHLTLWTRKQYFKTKGYKMKNGVIGYASMPNEFRYLLPGFYTANGNRSIRNDRKKGDILVRIYWNISALGAQKLVRNISIKLNNLNIPFQLKVSSVLSEYPRADACVLYINKKYYTKSIMKIRNIYSSISQHCLSFTPMMAKKIAPGLSLAEDPDNDESFGMHRSKLLAGALLEMYDKNIDSNEELILGIKNYFSNQRLDLCKPYLQPASIDIYKQVIEC